LIPLKFSVSMEAVNQFLMGEEPWNFLTEVVIRSVLAFIIVVLAIKATGKRGIRQLTIFELVIILTLGSAAGDVGFYKEVGVLTAFVAIVTIILMYRIITYLVLKFSVMERFLEGKPVVIIEDGMFTEHVMANQNISSDEFFMELRLEGVEHLGQVRKAILEVNGQISLFRNNSTEIKPGLNILPDIVQHHYKVIPYNGLHSCIICGFTEIQEKDDQPVCPSCHHNKWGRTSIRGCNNND
jgi:uncharacterized membrane protein YcaP (DUF421 family)